MSEEMKRYQKRRRMETVTIKLSMLVALLLSTWILYHAVLQATSGLAPLIP